MVTGPLAPPRTVSEYRRRFGEFEHAAEVIREAIAQLLTDAGINFHQIVARTKDPASAQSKIDRLRAAASLVRDSGAAGAAMADPSAGDVPGDGFAPEPAEITVADVHDLLGIRIICTLEPDVRRVAGLLHDGLEVLDTRDKTREVRERGEIGYGSLHLIARLGDAADDEHTAPYSDLVVEVQIRTILQDAWAQFEHGVRYKPRSGIVTPEVDRLLTLASGLLELADEQFARIQALQIEQTLAERQERADDADDAAHLDAGDVRDSLLEALPGSNLSRQSHYGWSLDLMSAMNIDTPGALRALLHGADFEELRRIMGYRYAPGPIRLLDDLLLLRFGEEYVERTQRIGDDPNRATKLRQRLERIRREAGGEPLPADPENPE